MARQQDKERQRRSTKRPSIAKKEALHKKHPYDPVGMAGRKAGIVKEIASETQAPQDEQRDRVKKK